jgi:hypothetical protein
MCCSISFAGGELLEREDLPLFGAPLFQGADYQD